MQRSRVERGDELRQVAAAPLELLCERRGHASRSSVAAQQVCAPHRPPQEFLLERAQQQARRWRPWWTDAQRQGGLERRRPVPRTGGQIQHIAWFQRDLAERRYVLEDAPVVGLDRLTIEGSGVDRLAPAAQLAAMRRGGDHRIAHVPQFAPAQLQHEDVVRVEVGGEAGSGRRAIDLGERRLGTRRGPGRERGEPRGEPGRAADIRADRRPLGERVVDPRDIDPCLPLSTLGIDDRSVDRRGCGVARPP